jgi:outer membrane protein TolC
MSAAPMDADMFNPPRPSVHCLAALALVVTLAPRASIALQRLEVFAAEARERNPAALEAGANLRERGAEADVALGRVLPGISFSGRYARNQHSSELDLGAVGVPNGTIVLLPTNQWTGIATATLPLLDLGNFERIAAARTGTEAAARQLDATRLDVEAGVAQFYYQLVASVALVGASNEALQVSREALRLAQEHYRAGTAAVLEVDRARAEVEQRVQQVASAELQVAVSSRALGSASGLTPDLSSSIDLDPDLRPEAPLSEFEKELPTVPAVAAAARSTRAAEQLATAQRLTLVPSIAGYFAETGSNAPGFVGRDWSYQAGATLTWSFDLTTFANIRMQDARADAARARELRAWLSSGDAIHQQWNTVVAGFAKSRAARAGRQAALEAAEQARIRYAVGNITQLDLLQAQRDAFTADVTRIQADAELANARVQLRLASGWSLVSSTKERNSLP